MELLKAFPIAVIDEDFEGKHAAGRGMQQLAAAIECNETRRRIDRRDARPKLQVDALLGVELVRPQRDPLVLRLAGQELLRQVRAIGRRRVVGADHRDRAVVAFAAEHLCRGQAGWAAGVELLAGSFEGEFFARPVAEAALHRRGADLRTAARLRAAGGIVLGSPASQHLFLLGGRETLPGYGYRSFSGDVFALTDLEVNRSIAAPWLGLRLLAAAGWTGWRDGPPADLATHPGPYRDLLLASQRHPRAEADTLHAA